MKILLKSALAIVALAASTPSVAALTLVSGGTCNIATPNPDAAACAGAYSGNLLNNNSIGDLNLALDALVGGNFTDVTWASLDPTKALVSGNGDDPTGTISFAQALSGDVIIGAHFGDAHTGLGDRTIFYRFNLAPGTTSLALNTQGFSDAVVIGAGAVPEPATWAMMLVGFAGVGFALRRRKTAAPQIA